MLPNIRDVGGGLADDAMTTPDLTAIRALVEAATYFKAKRSVLQCRICDIPWLANKSPRHYEGDHAGVYSPCPVPAAQAALNRMDEVVRDRDNFKALFKMEVTQKQANARLHTAAEARLAVLEDAQAQSARDVSYWRRRAESAEAMVQWQDTMRRRGPIIQGDAATTAEGRDE